MISENLARRIADEALAASTADETLVLVAGGKSALTRFMQNHVHQNVMQKDYHVSVVTAFGKRVGVASSNLFDRSELERLVDVSSTVAKRQKEDPGWEPLAGGFTYDIPRNAYDEETIEVAPERKVEMVRAMVEPSIKAKCKASGALTNSDECLAVATSKGLFAYYCWTSAELTLTVETEDGSSGWSEGVTRSIHDLDCVGLAKRALDKAKAARKPVDLAPGRYDVILEPPATTTIMRYLSASGFNGMAFVEGRSFLTGKLGEKLMGDNITMRDDYLVGARPGMPFDFEGFPRKRLTLIDKGVARRVVHDRRTAAQAKAENTGHALPYPNRFGPLPLNLMLEPGEISRDDQLRSLKKGLLITRSWYESIVDPKLPSLTGMTRDGTYLVEDGAVVRAVKNLRYNEDLRDLFSRVESLSKESESTQDWGGVVTAPSILVKDFHVTGSTK